MLEEQLNAARQARRQRSIKIAVGVVASAIICGVILAFATACCDFSKKDITIAEESLTAPQTEPVSEPGRVNKAAREDYLAALNDYQNTTEASLSAIDLERWVPDRARQIAQLKDAALNAFAVADYDTALDKITSARTLAENLINDASAQFSQALTAAANAYKLDDYERAKQQIDKALMLNRQSDEAQTLASDIASLAGILPLLQQAKVARTENNPEKELAIINNILAVAAEREAEQARKQELVNQLSLKNFKRHIDNAYAAIKQRDAASAGKHIASARAIYPNRGEIRDATQALESIQKQQRLADFSRAALDAMRQDNWADARQQLALAMSEQPNDKTLQGLFNKTETILSLTAQMEQYLANPYRLANSSIKANANDVLTESEAYRKTSLRLDQKAAELSLLIDDMSKKVSVKVLSDNKTNVLVRGVGIVGVTEAKTIELTPGPYKFEGKRSGYKSKLIEVLIPYDKSSMQLIVICDEPI